ncbi:MAG TPA: D-amino acid dehydrogenase [Burkholderiaceae bacterium]|nr:D-amino acid dehydrogenase [Burkholderiaceae bacterium]
MHVVVLGGGIVGTASAWFLRQDGHEVTLLERQPGVALETSFANACQISASQSEPWANPSAPLKILQWLGKEDAPLLFRLRADPHQWLWALQFLTHCTPGSTRSNIRDCVRLALHGRKTLRELRRDLALEYDQIERGILHFYLDPEQFEAARAASAIMRELGCDRRTVSAQQAVEIEPALAPMRDRIAGADYCAEDESGDILKFTQQLAQHMQARGVTILFNRLATRVLATGGRATGVEVVEPDGWHRVLDADAVVVALGSYSRELLLPLGIYLPLYPGKGYSATYAIVDPKRAPTVSVTDDAYKMAVTRLGDRLRVAGTAELSGFGRDLNPTRCEMLTRRARDLFPGAADYDNPRYWTGLRPMTPSNVPLIGRTRVPNVYVNTGHGTLGWTMGAGSGQIIADIVAGRTPAVPLRSVR